MYIQVTNIKLIFETQDAREPIGAEVEYKIVLKEGQSGRKTTIVKGQDVMVIDVPDDSLKGTIVLMNDKDTTVGEWPIWDFNRRIHENIMKNI